MRKLLFIAVISFGLTALASCGKSYTCTCISSEPNGNITETTKTEISAGSKSNAIEDCEELDNVMGRITTYCSLD